MSKTLIIVESPTKAKTISKFLGSQYMVESSFGHVRDLPKSNMGIDIENGTFEPTYRVSPDKTKQVKKLKDLAKKADQIIFATDEDREGEAISWHLAYILKIKPEQAKRIVFHEITKSAIEEALKHPRTIDQPLVDAQQARRVLDRLVGYELSPFLWKKVARGLSAGRVQSVAMRLIVEREKEREAFEPQEYWKIAAHFMHAKTPDHIIESLLHAVNGESLDKFALANELSATDIVNTLEGVTYTIADIEEKQTQRNPPPPFRTSTLQQQANQKFGYSSRQTMRLAQQLYEGIDVGETYGTVGLITYMRTDSTNLSTKFTNETKAFVQKKFGNTYDIAEPRVYETKAKGAQEAHEAIRPTHVELSPEKIERALDPQQFKLYSLIWKRAVATQIATAVLNKVRVDIAATGKDTKEYTFRTTGQSVHFDGWLRLYPEMQKTEMLPEMAAGENLECKELIPTQHFTQPPARYSDATLIKTLEEYGIGRPSTYAPTIGTIESRNYVERDENRRLKPTIMATIVSDLLVEHFSQIVDYQFTAQMEENLDAIAEGTKDWQPIISTFYHPFHENLVDKTENLSRQEIAHVTELGNHPKNGKPITARFGPYGPYVQCGTKDDEEKPRFASLRQDQKVDSITLEEALVLLSLPRTLGQMEDQDVKANIGRFGPYIQIGKEYFSMKKSEKDPYIVTFEEAQKIITEGREEKAKKVIKEFREEGLKILRGPYGPYLTDGSKNARIPKDTENPEELTLQECLELMKTAKPSRGRKGRKKTTPKKKAATKHKNR